MPLAPRLIDVRIPADPVATVLVLHGGGARRGQPAVSPAQLSVLRMVPIARRIARAGSGRLAVLRLLNSARGWDTRHTPVSDVAWALDQVEARFGTPVGLVGHSLGGRAALLSAAAPQVACAVAFAPWVYPDDVPAGLSGQRLLIVHGTEDRIASPARAALLAERLAQEDATVGLISVRGGKHAMLRRHRRFDRPAAAFTAAVLLGDAPGPAIRAALGGDRSIVA